MMQELRFYEPGRSCLNLLHLIDLSQVRLGRQDLCTLFRCNSATELSNHILLNRVWLSSDLKWTTQAIVTKTFTELHQRHQEGGIRQLICNFAQGSSFFLYWRIGITAFRALLIVAFSHWHSHLVLRCLRVCSTGHVLVTLFERPPVPA